MKPRLRTRLAVSLFAVAMLASGCSVDVADVYDPPPPPPAGETAAAPASDSAESTAPPVEPVEPAAIAETPDAPESAVDSVPATDAPTELAYVAPADGFSTWTSPTDNPIQLIKRTEGYRLESIVLLGEKLSGAEIVRPLLCSEVPEPEMLGRHGDRGAHNPKTEATYFLHPDAESAATYAAKLPEIAASCPADTPAAAMTYEVVDPATFEVDATNFRAWDVRGASGGFRVVTTHHGAVSVLYTAEHRPVVDADEYRSMLQDIRKTTLIFDSPAFSVPENDLWASDIEADDYLISELQTLHRLMSQDELSCLIDQLETLKRRAGILPPGAVVWEVARWCAPSALADSLMTHRRELANPIEDPTKRRCFLRVRGEFNAQGSFDEYLQRVVDRPEMDPFGADRAALDARLAAECNVGYTDGVIGGLEPREPIDQSPQRAIFCDAIRNKPPSPGTGVPEGPEEWVERYSYLLEAEANIVAPDTIADLWDRRQRRHQGMLDLYSTGKGEVELYSDVGYMSLDAEVDFAMLDRDFGEYLRINC